MTRTLVLALVGAACALAQDPPPMHRFDRQDFTVQDFQAQGYILDIGGGGEGVIGQMKPAQVIAIDLFKRELEDAPPGPLKIVMDATDLKFLDSTFDTVTAFFSLMYMKPDTQRKAFAEAFRVMRPGARWLIWDVEIPTALEKDTRGVVFYFRFHIPGKDAIQTGYGTYWPEKPMDLAWYKALAKEAGFEIAGAEAQPGAFHTITMELRKPAK